MKSGITDVNGLEISLNDTVEVFLTKNVTHKGVVIFKKGAFSLKVPRREEGLFTIFPFCNYVESCKITKI